MNMQNRDMTKAIEIAKQVDKLGGTVYIVGGYVRDKIMGIPNDDIDIEVQGIEAHVLENILDKLGNRSEQGAHFGIYKLDDYDLDIAMPRMEKATGKGHRDFQAFVDPYIGTYDAAIRRDFTINSIMENILTGEIIDEFNGMADIENKVIRHVNSESFIEDPLRVLRAARFAARFNYRIHPDTLKLCSEMDITTLSHERVYWELIKLFNSKGNPSIFFNILREINQLDYWFKELKALIGVEQPIKYHPEGDVWNHTMMVIDALKYCVESDYAGVEIEPINREYLMFAGLCHDLGKPDTTSYVDGKLRSIAHDIYGVKPSVHLIDRIANNKNLKIYVTNMVELHMKPNLYVDSKASMKKFNKLFDDSVDTFGLLLLAKADHLGRLGATLDEYKDFETKLMESLDTYTSIMSKPYVTGKDLVAHGLKPDKSFSKVLEYSHKLRLAGVDKDKALKQTIRFAEELSKQGGK